MLKAGSAGGQVPPPLMEAFNQLYANYKRAVVTSGAPGATEDLVAKTMASVCERVLLQLTHPYTFPSAHERILAPYNYYEFGQRYIRGLVDFQHSLLGHEDRFAEVEAALAKGENVVLLANHQTEADPAAFALLLEKRFPRLATDVVYVAGDRVVTDALCAPFSMGRNLFCVHSKKHLDDIPELKAEKQATNRRTLVAMSKALAAGGRLLWIAPSGGRDRSVDPATGEPLPDEFDPTAVELMRALMAKAGHPGHLYPFAMYTKRIMPPPDSVEKSMGEERRVFHAPVGISIGAEIKPEELLQDIPEGDKEARQRRLADTAWHSVMDEYKALVAAISGPGAGGAYTQPWLEGPQRPLDQY